MIDWLKKFLYKRTHAVNRFQLRRDLIHCTRCNICHVPYVGLAQDCFCTLPYADYVRLSS